MPDTSDKDFIRHQSKAFRDRLEIDPNYAERAAHQFLSVVPHTPHTRISLYFPRGKELDTSPLVELLWARNIACLLPVTNGDEVMQFAKWEPHTKLKEGEFKIPVPVDPEFLAPDVLVIPLLAFDQTGMRLGYGKGHYDRAIAFLRASNPNIITVGYAYAQQACLFALPAEPHDQRMNFVVTPERVFDFRA
jgi:5-formyltetrahydrofolate cyclo-ligase